MSAADYGDTLRSSGKHLTRVGCHSSPAAAGEESAVSGLQAKADPSPASRDPEDNARFVSRTYLINRNDRKRTTSSGAKAQFLLAFNVGAKAPTPSAPFMGWLLDSAKLSSALSILLSGATEFGQTAFSSTPASIFF